MNEPDVSDLLTVDQAIATVDATPVTPRIVRIELGAALGLHLAEDVVADRDYPPFDKSLMDGYAVRAGDVTRASNRLHSVGEIAAGAEPGGVTIDAGQTAKIMTGAALPRGADAVVPVEMARGGGDDVVELSGPAIAWRFVARRGSDCRGGEVVLSRGQRLEAVALAVAATVGAAEVNVFAPPRVAVLSTGDEIVPFERAPGAGQIRDSNRIMLLSLLKRLGCDARDAGTVADDPALIRAAIERAIDDNDVLMVTGGMSMGDYDYVPRILREMGAELKITKLRIKPGKPFVFATIDPAQIRPLAASRDSSARFVFGLPGNPVSGFACTVRLCARLLWRLAGAPVPREKWTRAVLNFDLPPNGPREFYQPAQLNSDGTVQALEWKGSGDVFTLARANALLVRAADEPAQRAGAEVRVLEIPS